MYDNRLDVSLMTHSITRLSELQQGEQYSITFDGTSATFLVLQAGASPLVFLQGPIDELGFENFSAPMPVQFIGWRTDEKYSLGEHCMSMFQLDKKPAGHPSLLVMYVDFEDGYFTPAVLSDGGGDYIEIKPYSRVELS